MEFVMLSGSGDSSMIGYPNRVCLKGEQTED